MDDLRVLASHLFLDAVNAQSIHAYLDNPSPCSSSNDLIGFQPQIELLHLEYLTKLTYKLHRKLLLPHVIIRLDYNPEQLPRMKMSKW